MKKLIVFLLACASFSLYAQRWDYNWVGGYNNPITTISTQKPFGGVTISFNTQGSPAPLYTPRSANMGFLANATMSNSRGILQFYTNGLCIYDATNDTMQNAPKLITNGSDLGYNPMGYMSVSGILALSFPNNDSIYYLLNTELGRSLQDGGYWYGEKLKLTRINMNVGNHGAVTTHQVIASDSMQPGALAACRHANGRDWWVLAPQYQGSYTCPGIHRLLITPNGVAAHDTLPLPTWIQGDSIVLGSAIFSPNGQYYFLRGFNCLYYWDFDRCTGTISTQRRYNMPMHMGSGNGFIESSPNSRYLYSCDGGNGRLTQYDLLAPNLLSSGVVLADYPYIQGWPNACTFPKLAPDGKIYLSTDGNDTVLHVIEYPDSVGFNCSLQLRSYNVHARFGAYPNAFPHYRLGAEKESPCDSLGLPATYSLAAKTSVVQPLCADSAIGSASVAPTGGIPPYHYLWSNADTTAAVSNLAAGAYTCTVTDSLGAVFTATATIVSPTALVVSADTVANTSPLGNGQAIAQAAGGTPPYQYVWNTGATTDTLSGLFKGTYSCIITDAHGCTRSVQATVGGIALGIANSVAAAPTAIFAPNPAATEVTVAYQIPNDATLTLYNLMGQTVGKYTLSAALQQQNISVTTLKSGIYVYTIEGRGVHLTGKLSINR